MERQFTQFFKRHIGSGVLRAHNDGYRTRRHFFGHAGDNLRRFVHRKAPCGLILGAVGRFKEYALSRIGFIYFELLAFDDYIVADGERAVF